MIFPEIEIYDKGFNIPRTKKDISNADNNENVVNNIINNYYNKNSFLLAFFDNLKLLDINLGIVI